ncbi:hypothetical protein EPN95_00170 [Patescibacteria group bacterium]|nr:MAG: hypothetical protein EPN95_00170 [Patescibacteria group bacterium]
MDTKRFQKQREYIQSLKSTSIVRFFVANKQIIGVILILIFLFLFGYYIALHPSIISEVLNINPLIGIVIFVLYFGVILTNFVIMYAVIKLRGRTLPAKNGLLLTMYSSVINFFGPLQSGPGIRAVYLKTKVGLRIRDYAYAMLFYYGAFAAINIALLFINTIWWLTLLGLAGAAILAIIATRLLKLASFGKFLLLVFVGTLIQIIFIIIIYGTELATIDPSSHLSITQIISYTASANLSLFVSLTPGGIGIREAFLIFSQSLHHIGLSSIVAAGVLDRALYIIFLLVIFVVSSSMHLRQTFAQKKQS